ncbi:hypothetical protein [Streptomyces sp. 8N706]|uniref:hypothetical protein n=1 Tax=Streptomyces sp. 8N706 TaxID=3457416 RepID=UPI003FD41AD7
MSEIADTSRGVPPMPRNGEAGPPTHEAYSFACMRCGHGWEQAYEIRHHADAQGRAVVTYYANGKRVPSPLTRPTCINCDGHVVRIMRSGQIPTAAAALEQQGIAGPLLSARAPMEPPVPTAAEPVTRPGAEPAAQPAAEPVAQGAREPAVAAPSDEDRPGPEGESHHRHLSDLLHVFHRK